MSLVGLIGNGRNYEEPGGEGQPGEVAGAAEPRGNRDGHLVQRVEEEFPPSLATESRRELPVTTIKFSRFDTVL